jgi:serine/threonine protein phosphatase PrpC
MSTEPVTAEMHLDSRLEPPLLVVEHAALSDRGLRRPRNEDAYLADPPVFAVADGVGGNRGGQVAARLAIRELAAASLATLARPTGLVGAVDAANARIHAAGETVASFAGMATTLTAVAVVDGELRIAHVGDSRLYRVRDGRLDRLTRDHTYVEELIRSGRLQPAEAGTHRWRSILSRALGLDPDVEVDGMTYPGVAGDVHIVCSDGLTKALSDEQIQTAIAQAPTLAAAAHALVASANSQGGRDNVTVVMFRLAAREASSSTRANGAAPARAAASGR